MNRVLLLAIIACFGALSSGAYFMSKLLAPVAAPDIAAQAAVIAPAAAPTSAAAPVPSGRVALVKPDQAGQFRADVTINGRSIRMLIDTGASLVALTQQDAITLGVLPLSFNVPVQTASGTARAGEAKLSEIRIGNVQANDIGALVLPPGVAGHSLLGMSFLRKLSGFEVAGGNLILKQ